MKKIKERESQAETLDILLTEIKKAADKNDEEKAKSMYSKAKHLYRYMTKEEKQKAKPKIDDTAKFLRED